VDATVFGAGRFRMGGRLAELYLGDGLADAFREVVPRHLPRVIGMVNHSSNMPFVVPFKQSVFYRPEKSNRTGDASD
jgi:hypothetical protein